MSGYIATLRCRGCGAEVVVNAALGVGARCHWCRSVLSPDDWVPNGPVPDAVLPFTVPHDQAVAAMRKYVGVRMAFAKRGFRRRFRPENVVGVYMPYFVVDVDAEVALEGEGEIQTGGDSSGYEVDVYHVEREFGLEIDDLAVASPVRRTDSRIEEWAASHGLRAVAAARSRARELDAADVIDAALPSDVKDAVRFDLSHLGAYTSEKREIDVSQVNEALSRRVLEIGTAQIRSTLGLYPRGVRWERGAVGIKDARVVTVYAPVWLYSCYERQRDGTEHLHCITVNGTTGWTMGSIPPDKKRLVFAALGGGILPYAYFVAGQALHLPETLMIILTGLIGGGLCWFISSLDYGKQRLKDTAGRTGHGPD